MRKQFEIGSSGRRFPQERKGIRSILMQIVHTNIKRLSHLTKLKVFSLISQYDEPQDGRVKKGYPSIPYGPHALKWGTNQPITMPFIHSLEDPIGCKGFQVAGPWSYWEKGKGFWKPNYYNWVYECASHVILPRCTLSLHHFIHFVGNRRAKGEIEGPWYEIYWGGSWLM